MTTPVTQYLVAWANNPRDDPSAFGIVTGTVTINNWTDITSYVQSATWNRGRAHELANFQPGTATLLCENKDGVFSPWNTSSPFNGFLRPMRWLQIRVGGVARWTGHLTSLPEQWPSRRERYVTLTAQDPLALLAQKNIISNAYAATVIADGATAYYRLGDSSAVDGAVCTDSSGNARHGAYHGTVVPLASPALIADVNTACDFGTSGTANAFGYATIPDTAWPLTTSVASVEMWFKARSDWATVAAPTFGTLPLTLRNNCAGFATNLSNPPDRDGSIQVAFGDGTHTSNPRPGATGTNVCDGLWHHIVAVLESDRKTCHEYVDGVLAATAVSATAIDFSLTTFVLSSTIMRGGDSALYPVNGYADEVAIYFGVSLTATQIANHYALGLGSFGSQLSGARITAVLDALGWPAGMRSIGVGASTLQAQTVSLATTKALSHMQTVETTEAGALFCDAAGKVTYVDRNTIATTAWGAVVATFGDGAAEIHFEPGASPALDTVDLYTEATVQRNNGVTQFASDAAAGALYGERTRSITGTLSSTDAESLGRAQWEVDHYHAPLDRLPSITIDVAAQGPTVAAAVAACQLLSLVQINRTDITGTSFAQTAVVEGISEDASDVTYHATLSLSPVQAQLYWILGTSALDTTTRLSF